MELHSSIQAWLLEHNNHITTQEFVACGLSKTMLTRYIDAGLLLRVGHGVYTLPETTADVFYRTALHSKHIVFSHESALYLHGLLARIPQKLTVTIPSNASLRKEVRERCICHYADERVHSIGIVEKATACGNIVPCYDMERTVCDYIRCRNRYSDNTILDVLQVYFGRRGRNVQLLAEYAAIFGISWVMEQYMDALR